MSVQILLHGKLLGTDDFLLSGTPDDELFLGRSRWVSLLMEVLPRGLLAERGLARILLGASGGGQFLLVLPSEARAPVEERLGAAAAEVDRLGRGRLRLIWAVTENLGDWSIVRKRLADELQRKRGTPAAGTGADAFQPLADGAEPDETYFRELARRMWEAESAGWQPETPAQILIGEGKHTWPLGTRSVDGISMARHLAPNEEGTAPASPAAVAARAEGRAGWGVLRGDVDGFGVRMRRLQTIEEHVQLSVMTKQFFAGELEVLCSQPEFWRKVTIVYSGGDDFAVYGAWDALLLLGREMQRLFHRFAEENLKEFPGPEGKTISMAAALAQEPEALLACVFHRAGERLEWAKAADKDCIYAFGRTLEWKQLADAADLKDTLVRMAADMGTSRNLLAELGGFYRRSGDGTPSGEHPHDRPWRIQRRLSRVVGGAREREFQKLRAHFINERMGRGAAQVRLRPAGRVALEWARLATEV